MKRPVLGESDAALERATDTDSLRRGLEILRCFTFHRKTLALGEVVDQTGIPRPTALKLLNTLVAHHFLRFLPDGDRYEPDVACFVVGHALRASVPVVRAARPVMQALSEKFDVDVLLAFEESAEMMVADCCKRSSEANEIGVGATMPLGGSAAGHAWLWSQRASVQGTYMERIRTEAGGAGRSVMPAIYRAFQELEERGYCVSTDGRGEGSRIVATPLAMRDGDDVFVLACAAAKTGFEEVHLRNEVAPGMLEAASRIVKEMSRTVAG